MQNALPFNDYSSFLLDVTHAARLYQRVTYRCVIDQRGRVSIGDFGSFNRLALKSVFYDFLGEVSAADFYRYSVDRSALYENLLVFDDFFFKRN